MVIAGLSGFAIIFILTYPHGVGISPDSVDYTATARHIITQHNIYTFNGKPLVIFPALFPFFLAITMFLSGHDIIEIAPFINALLFGLAVFCSGLAIEKFLNPSRWLRWVLLLLIVTSISILRVYYMLWSETLFILLSFLFFLSLHAYFKTYRYTQLIVAALIVALSCVTRYAGISLVGMGCIMILCDSQSPIRKKIAHTVVFGFIACSLLAINLFRNYSVSGTLTGHRKPGITPLADNIYYCGKAVISWFLPSTEETNIPFIFGFGVAILFLVLIAFVFIKNVRSSNAFGSVQNITLTFSFAYFGLMIVSATFSRYQEIDYRLMSPLFIPLTLGLGGMVAKWSGDVSRSRRKWVMAIAVLLAGTFEINQIMSFSTLPNQDSYADNEWRTSSVANFLKDNKGKFKGDTLVSNSNYAVYFFTGMDADPLPDREYPSDVQSFYNRRNIYLIWFTKDENEGDLTLDEILKNKPMTLVKKFDDGWIYRSNEEVLKK